MIAILATVFAALAALLHVYIFVMESVQWTQPRVWKRFGVPDQAAADTTKPMAYNQGFYNLFLAIGAVLGLVLFWAGARGHAAADRRADPRAVQPRLDGRGIARAAHERRKVPAARADPGHAAAHRVRAVPVRLTTAGQQAPHSPRPAAAASASSDRKSCSCRVLGAKTITAPSPCATSAAFTKRPSGVQR